MSQISDLSLEQQTTQPSTIHFPSVRNHRYFKAALLRRGLTRELVVRAYTTLIAEIRQSIYLGYQVDVNPLLKFNLYLKLKGDCYLPFVKPVLHQAVSHPQAMAFAPSLEELIVNDQDWPASKDEDYEFNFEQPLLEGPEVINYSAISKYTDANLGEIAENEKLPSRMNAYRIIDGNIQYPMLRDHKYFKQALYRAGFTKEMSTKIYNWFIADIRDSVAEGYQVRIDQVFELIPYMRRKPSGFTPSIVVELHQSLQNITSIRYSTDNYRKVTISDPDWE